MKQPVKLNLSLAVVWMRTTEVVDLLKIWSVQTHHRCLRPRYLPNFLLAESRPSDTWDPLVKV